MVVDAWKAASSARVTTVAVKQCAASSRCNFYKWCIELQQLGGGRKGGGNAVTSTSTQLLGAEASIIFGTLSSLTLVPRGAAPPRPSGRQGPRPLLLTNGK